MVRRLPEYLFCVLFKKRIIFTLVIFCIHLKRFTLIQKHITLYMHRKTYETQNRLLFMCFKSLTFDRNNRTTLLAMCDRRTQICI
jgi:hypothetical protein